MAGDGRARDDSPGTDDWAGTGDVLDLGVVGDVSEPAEEAGPGAPPGVSRRGLLLTGAGALVAGALGVAVSSTTRSAADAKPAAGPAPPAPVSVGRLARPLPAMAGAGGWELLGLGSDVLVRVQPGTGQVVRTRIASLGDGQVSLVPVRRRVLIRPLGDGSGYVVPDGAAPVPMPSALAGVGALLPGPNACRVWNEVLRGRATQMALVSVDGRRRPVVVPVPEFATTGPMTDGGGGLLFEGVGGLYRISPAGRLQVSNAIVLAVGGGGLLTLERDTRDRWRTMLRPPAGPARVVPVPIGPQLPHGVLSPDGRTVALYVVNAPTSIGLALVDLPSGALRILDLDVTGVAGDGCVVWTPDSRRLFCVDADGQVRLVDAVALHGSMPALGLPALRQLAVRQTT